MSPPWIDKIALQIMEQKNLAKEGNFDPYFKQLEVASEAAVKGTYDGKRKGMNRFLEMLEAKEGGISAEAAHKIFAAVVKSVPYAVLLPLKSEDKLDPEENAHRPHETICGIYQRSGRARSAFVLNQQDSERGRPQSRLTDLFPLKLTETHWFLRGR